MTVVMVMVCVLASPGMCISSVYDCSHGDSWYASITWDVVLMEGWDCSHGDSLCASITRGYVSVVMLIHMASGP